MTPTTLYCECERPVIDIEHDDGCRRCGRPIDFSPRERWVFPESVARELYDAALAVRPHVEEAEGWYRALLLEGDATTCAELLERLDGAVADAAEYLT